VPVDLLSIAASDENELAMTAGNYQAAPAAESAADPTAGRAAFASIDEPMDAMVYDQHPAMQAAVEAGYPYGPRGRLPPAQHEPLFAANGTASALAAVDLVVKAMEGYWAALQSPPDFVVPKTFGMSAILGLMTVLALLFACLRWLDSYPVFYFFFSVQAITICLAQMFYGKTPRVASIVAGAIILPLFTIVAGFFSARSNLAMVCLAIGFIPLGALLGYLTGTCAAGIFLVMEYLEPYLQGQGFSRSRSAR
jgi:hypothetical protein